MKKHLEDNKEMVKKHLFFILYLLVFSIEVYANDFIDSVLVKSNAYEGFEQKDLVVKLELEGKKNQIDKKLIALVSDKFKTAEDYFILSNKLYNSNHQLSFDLMLKAYALMPDEIYINFELALHYHRDKKYNQAIKYYQIFHSSQLASEHHSSYAMIADCYLRIGEYKKAIDSWMKADPKNNARSIEKAIYNIYGEERPLNKRADIYERINKGENHLYGDLILLDHNWKIDWWNTRANETYLAYDLNHAKLKLGEHSTLYQELMLLNEILLKSINTSKLLKKLMDMKIWGKKSNLPKLSVLTYFFIKRLTDLKLVETKTLLHTYEKALLAKLKTNQISEHEFKILSFLYWSENSDKLERHDLFGWKERDSQVSAESYIEARYKKKIDVKNDLKQALVDFPNSTHLNTLNVTINKGSNETQHFAALVAAQFPNLKYESNIRSLYEYFFSLEKMINHKL